VKERDEFDQRGCGNLWFSNQFESRTPRARYHPFRKHCPRAIRQEACEGAAAVGQPQLALDGQRLADERVPGIVNGGEARKLRSM